MSDPAIEAVRRAWHYKAEHSWQDKCSGLAAAREALKPIHKWYGKAMAEAIAEDLFEQADLLDDLAPLIFATEELER